MLGTLKTADSRRLLGTYLDELTAGKLSPDLQIDLVEAAQTDAVPAADRAPRGVPEGPQGGDPRDGALREGLLHRRGRAARPQVVVRNPAAECTRCHTIEWWRRRGWPESDEDRATLTRDQLVESLLEPNTRIAPGFGTVGITLRNGPRVDGTLREETRAMSS